MKTKELTEKTILKALDWAYEKAVNGFPGMQTAEQMAIEFLNDVEKYEDEFEKAYKAANSLIRWQNGKAATTGFLTGLGGAITLPVSIPADLGSVLYIQLRMIAAIACMGGYNVKDNKVKTLAYVCLTGSSVFEVVKGTGIKVGQKMAESMLKNMSAKVLKEINKKVGFRLLTKFGEKGVVNFSKMIPVVGGFIGGTLDAVATNTVGNTARKVFIGQKSNNLKK